jgi:predicted site-specific integrase-resolvase
MDPKKAYTIAEAATAYGVSPDVIRRHIKAGNIAVKYPTSKPVIPADELEAWFAALPSEH